METDPIRLVPVIRRCWRCGDEAEGKKVRLLCSHCEVAVPHLRRLGYSDEQIERMGEYDPPNLNGLMGARRVCLVDALRALKPRRSWASV